MRKKLTVLVGKNNNGNIDNNIYNENNKNKNKVK